MSEPRVPRPAITPEDWRRVLAVFPRAGAALRAPATPAPSREGQLSPDPEAWYTFARELDRALERLEAHARYYRNAALEEDVSELQTLARTLRLALGIPRDPTT